MQSKGFIKLIAVLLALACVYQLSFTFKTRGVEKQAAAYAAQFPLDQQGEAEQHYLDSVQNLPVYNLGFRKFTYKECKEKELNMLSISLANFWLLSLGKSETGSLYFDL